jgi:hypothetical protein
MRTLASLATLLVSLTAATSAHAFGVSVASTDGMPPTIDGVPVEGQTVTASWPSANGTPSYQWQRCKATYSEADPCAGMEYENLDGATSQSHQLDSRSTNRLIRVVGGDADGTYTSGAIGPVGGGGTDDPPPDHGSSAPVNKSRPTMTRVTGNGNPDKTGDRLRYSPGTWTGSPAPTLAPQWMRCTSAWASQTGDNPNCKPIAGATGTDYTLAEADIGQYVVVRERAENSVGSATRDSGQTGQVTGPPRWQGTPAIQGSPVRGQTLSFRPISWADRPGFQHRVEWERCGAAVGQTQRCTVVGRGETYQLSDSDLHHQIYVTEYGKTYVEAGVTSAPVGPVTVPSVTVKIEKPVIGDESWDAQAKIRKLLGDGEKTRVSFKEKRVFVADRALPNGGKGIEPLDVINVDPPSVTVPTPKVEVELKIWMGAHEGDSRLCPKIRAQLKGADLDSAIDTLRRAHCSFDDLLFERSKKVSQPTVVSAPNGKRPDVRVMMPASPADTDIRLFLSYGSAGGYGNWVNLGTDWKLSAGHENVVGVFAVDRAGRLLKGTKISAEGASIGVVDESDTTADNGNARLVVKPTGAGTVDLFAEFADRDGDKIYGYGQIPVVKRDGDFRTIIGETWYSSTKQCTGGANYCLLRSGSTATARAANLDWLWNGLRSLLYSFKPNAQKAYAGAKSPAAGLNTLAKGHQTSAMLGLMGQPAGPTQKVIAPTRVNDGVWVISSDGASVIATGGGNVIATGGGNVIATGGGNLISDKGLGVISTGGGNVIATGGGNVIATGGGNLVALPNNGGYVIATGGGNMIATGGRNVISTGGGN